MTALALLQQLHERGVIVTPYPDGTVRCRAPKGVLTPALHDARRPPRRDCVTRVARTWERRAQPSHTYGGSYGTGDVD